VRFSCRLAANIRHANLAEFIASIVWIAQDSKLTQQNVLGDLADGDHYAAQE
jgi:hypothetical protein